MKDYSAVNEHIINAAGMHLKSVMLSKSIRLKRLQCCRFYSYVFSGKMKNCRTEKLITGHQQLEARQRLTTKLSGNLEDNGNRSIY